VTADEKDTQSKPKMEDKFTGVSDNLWLKRCIRT